MSAGDFVQKNFRIRSSLENVAVGFHLGTEFIGIGDVAVVDNRQLPPLAAHEYRLRIRKSACARRTVTHVTDTRKSLQFVNVVFS